MATTSLAKKELNAVDVPSDFLIRYTIFVMLIGMVESKSNMKNLPKTDINGGIAENWIKLLSESAHSVLAHGMDLWYDIVTKFLWPFTVKSV